MFKKGQNNPDTDLNALCRDKYSGTIWNTTASGKIKIVKLTD